MSEAESYEQLLQKNESFKQELIEALEADNQRMELLASYFENVLDVTFFKGGSMSGRDYASQLRNYVFVNRGLISRVKASGLGTSYREDELRVIEQPNEKKSG
jgi:hypothetical protein